MDRTSERSNTKEGNPPYLGGYFQRKCGRGEIGRRAGFRFLWVTPYGFKSLRPHQKREHLHGVLFFGMKRPKTKGFEGGSRFAVAKRFEE